MQGVYDSTAAHRRPDLVFIQNGIVRTMLPHDAACPTVAVLYFSVLERGGDAKSGGCSFVHGRFASVVADMLRAGGIECKEVASRVAIDSLAAEKLLWATCMWMVSHANFGITVGQVHDSPEYQKQLRAIVAELLPIARRTLLTEDKEETDPPALDCLCNVLARLEAYSRRIPTAVPSKKLALEELPYRNGWFLQHGAASDQPSHIACLAANGVDVPAFITLLNGDSNSK